VDEDSTVPLVAERGAFRCNRGERTIRAKEERSDVRTGGEEIKCIFY